jgi:hypothetical protein
VYGFTLDGTSVQGWKRPGLNEEIVDPVALNRAKGGWYVMIAGRSGNTMIVDRNGTQRVVPGPKFLHAPSSGFFINKTGKKGTFLTTEPSGKVVFIQENGRSSEVTLNLFSPAHRFFYEDITGNGQHEFIFIDRDKIYYYSQGFKLIYSYQFRHVISSPPFIVRAGGEKVMIGFSVPETNELFLFDEHGYHELESGIRGNTPFDIGNLGASGHNSLVVGAGKFVKCYRLPKPD